MQAKVITLSYPKKSVESTTYYLLPTTGGAYCTESKAFFTFLKLAHKVTWFAARKWIASKKQNSLYIQYIRPPRYDSTDLFGLYYRAQMLYQVTSYNKIAERSQNEGQHSRNILG